MSEWFTLKNAEVVDTPALIIYPERVSENIALAIKAVGDVDRLRPHVKTSKCANIIEEIDFSYAALVASRVFRL